MMNQLTWYHLPPADLPAINAYMTFTRLTLLQGQDGQSNDNLKHPNYSNTPLVNQTTECSHLNQDLYSHSQSTVILQQFSIIIQEL